MQRFISSRGNSRLLRNSSHIFNFGRKQLKKYSKNDWKTYQGLTDEHNWKIHTKATEFANELMSKSAQKLDAAVELIPMKSFLQVTESSSPDIIITERGRFVWDFVYESLKKPDSHLIVSGNPGIGKSRSMMWLLRKLLIDQQTVVFESRKDMIVFAFIPNEETKYDVHTIDSRDFRQSNCAVLQNTKNFYLVDTGAPSEVVPVPAHTVLAASPNKQHYHEFRKRVEVNMVYMSLWSLEELLAAREYLGNISEDEMRERYMMFGGVPRHVLDPYYSKLRLQFTSAVSKVSFNTLMQAISSRNVEDSQATESRVSSMLFCYEVDAKDPSEVRGLRPVSDYVTRFLATKYWRDLMNEWNPNSILFAGSGPFWETLVKMSIAYGGTFTIKDLRTGEKSLLKLEKVKTETVVGGWEEFINACALLQQTRQKVLVPSTSNQPVVDLMDTNRRAYQATINLSHGLKAKQLSTLLAKLGANEQDPLQLYFVVPPLIFDTFEEQPIEGVRKMDEKTGNKKFDEKVLRASMQQFALCMSELPKH